MVKVSKTLEYYRAEFQSSGQDLESLIRDAWEKLDTHEKRTVKFKNNELICGLKSKDFEGNGFAIHCGKCTDGQGVGTIPTPPEPQVEIGERLPGRDENFLTSDFIALIHNNHIVCTGCRRNAGALRMYLIALFKKAGFSDAERDFFLKRIADPRQLATIKKAGVKSVELVAGISATANIELSEDEDKSGVWRKTKRGFNTMLSAITDRDESVQQLQEATKGTLRVSINVPNGDLEGVKSSLDKFAEEIIEDSDAFVEDSDAFVVRLRNDSVIKIDEFSVRKKINIEAFANSVNISEAWGKMEEYMEELRKDGQLRA